MSEELCGCIRCTDQRIANMSVSAPIWERFKGPGMPGWRYACERCGNKRCPHHSNHEFACTNSNEPGQPGSIYE